MDEQRKNPYRRAPKPPVPTERRPGLRQLPKDLEDLATGKADRVHRPRREPAPLFDEREGAVIPGVRNVEARAVYDARVASLRADLAAGREGELRAGLEDTRRLALWRARNVTDYRAFAESVIGVAPELAASWVEEASAENAAPEWPAHTAALAIRVEAALLARSTSVRVRLHADEAGPRMSLDLPAAEVSKAVEALADVGRAATGLRRFLRGEDSRDTPGSEPRNDGPRFDDSRGNPRFDDSRGNPRFDDSRGSNPRFDNSRGSNARSDNSRGNPRFDDSRRGGAARQQRGRPEPARGNKRGRFNAQDDRKPPFRGGGGNQRGPKRGRS